LGELLLGLFHDIEFITVLEINADVSLTFMRQTRHTWTNRKKVARRPLPFIFRIIFNLYNFIYTEV